LAIIKLSDHNFASIPSSLSFLPANSPATLSSPPLPFPQSFYHVLLAERALHRALPQCSYEVPARLMAPLHEAKRSMSYRLSSPWHPALLREQGTAEGR